MGCYPNQEKVRGIVYGRGMAINGFRKRWAAASFAESSEGTSKSDMKPSNEMFAITLSVPSISII